MRTKEEYFKGLARMKRNLYFDGQRIDRTDELQMDCLNTIGTTYDEAARPENQNLLTAISHLTGKRINRFTHIHQNTDDLIKKSKMGRLIGSLTGCCFQRCVGMDALNALSITTSALDSQGGTEYNRRFLQYLEYIQENDLTCDGAMTDPKGDRSLPPHAQADPDSYLRIVERRTDGIVIRGAKAHQTGAVNSHEIIVMPTMAMREEDREYAVAFAVPSDTPGITYILGRQSCDTRKLEGGTFDRGNLFFGGHEALGRT